MKTWAIVRTLALALPLSSEPGPAQAAQSEDIQPIAVVGSIEKVVEAILPFWASKVPTAITYRRQSEAAAETALFEIYNSKYSVTALYKDNCVSGGWEKVVDCDLKMIDDLIDEFYLLKIYASKGHEKAARHSYRRSILLWILSHELGHIELGHGRSDYREDIRGLQVFDAASQAKELQADEYSIGIIGNIDKGSAEAYSTVLDITNSLIRKSVCPRSYPRVCKEMPAAWASSTTTEPMRSRSGYDFLVHIRSLLRGFCASFISRLRVRRSRLPWRWSRKKPSIYSK